MKMAVPEDIPFEVGQAVESRSFQEGFRGAWFRSKIKTISKRKGELGFRLDFLDFPDEENTWTKAYQKPMVHEKNVKRIQGKKHELMIRPAFPSFYRKSEMPDVNTISEMVVEVNDEWKVGDLIDWWKDDCYWSGSIVEISKDDKYQICLLPPPHGEGLPYEAYSKDFRPSLHWSLENGWTVPIPKDTKLGCCARIINPIKQGNISSPAMLDKEKDEDTAEASQSPSESSSSSTKPRKDRLVTTEMSTTSSAARKDSQTPEIPRSSNPICPESGSSSHAKSKSIEVTETCNDTAEMQDSVSMAEEKESQAQASSAEEGEILMEKGGIDLGKSPKKSTSGKSSSKSTGNSPKKSRADKKNLPLNSMSSDSIEASIMDLEELLQRVKWMKGLLKNGKASSSSSTDDSKPPWKFLEQRGPTKPK